MGKQLYVTITTPNDDTFVLGAVKEGGLTAVSEWVAAEFDAANEAEMLDMRYTIGFTMMTEEEVNNLPEP